jgi:hypothetical protein
MYAARAAAILKDPDRLEAFSRDADDNVRHAALVGLHPLVRHQAAAVYLANLKRSDYQLLMMAATALEGTAERGAADEALSTRSHA